MCEGLLPLFLPDGSQIPKNGTDSPGSLPGGWEPKPKLKRETGVSQLDVPQGCLVSEQYQGFVLREKGKMAVGSQPPASFSVSKDTSTDRKWVLWKPSVLQGREHPRWLRARSLRLAASPHLLLVMFPLGLGWPWGSESRG